jgi:hypothetical protein
MRGTKREIERGVERGIVRGREEDMETYKWG